MTGTATSDQLSIRARPHTHKHLGLRLGDSQSIGHALFAGSDIPNDW